MKNLVLLFGSILFLGVSAISQEEASFTVELSSDSILMGNYFEVRFTLENAQGNTFEAPEFNDFVVAGGPNMASRTSIMNGEVSQTITYSYILQPKEIGNYYIYPASIAVGDKILESDPVELMVVPNPDGIKQEIPANGGLQFRWGDFGDSTPQPLVPAPETTPQKKKKKKKLYKL